MNLCAFMQFGKQNHFFLFQLFNVFRLWTVSLMPRRLKRAAPEPMISAYMADVAENLMMILDRWVMFGPSIDLDFINGKSY